MTAVFLLRTDSITSLKEGEVYYVRGNGIYYCDVWNSPKLLDHKVIVATGSKEIQQVLSDHKDYAITQKP